MQPLDERVNMSFAIGKKLKARLSRMAKRDGLSVSAWLRERIEREARERRIR